MDIPVTWNPISWFNYIGSAVRFSGGLTQSDWFVLGSTAIITGYAPAVYNQTAYANVIGLRQAQMYQAKNYKLAFCSIARGDIRQLMSISVSRINNYMVVATLFLALNASALFWVNNFSSQCPPFVVNFFWVSMCTSIVFLSEAIMFGIKGQNGAFINTMRLLTWEERPENPAAYDHDFTKQIQNWEQKPITEGVWRWPKRVPLIYNKDARAPDAATAVASKEGDPNGVVLEEVEPPTRDLIYLARFAHFMRLWVPYEIYAKYSIGLGLLNLAQGAAYFSLGSLSWYGSSAFTEVMAWLMILMFVFLTVMIYAENYVAKNRYLQFSVVALFMWGPLTATLAVSVAEVAWLRSVLVCFSAFGSSVLNAGIFMISVYNPVTPAALTESYVHGPHGQKFKEHWHPKEEAERQTGPELEKPQKKDSDKAKISAVPTPMTSSSGGRRGKPAESQELPDPSGKDWYEDSTWKGGYDPEELPSRADELEEEKQAQMVMTSVVRVVRWTVAMASVIWFVIFFVCALDTAYAIGPTALPGVEVTLQTVSWPTTAFRPNGLSCSPGGGVYVSNRYQVFSISADGSGSVTRALCSRKGIINDIKQVCDSNGYCQLLALVGQGLDADAPASRLIDCESGATASLLQEPSEASVFAIRSSGSFVQNPSTGTVLAIHNGAVVEYGWQQRKNGWVPIWSQAQVTSPGMQGSTPSPENEIYDIDMYNNNLFLFGRQAPLAGGVEDGGISTIEVRSLQTGSVLGKWRLPIPYPSLVAGCVLDSNAALILTDDTPAKLMRIQIPSYSGA